MRQRNLILVLVYLTTVVVGWVLWPRLVVGSLMFVEKKGELPSRRACDRIVLVGERAIPAIIDSIEEHSPWVRRYCYLPIALGEIGGSAETQLIKAIEEQNNPQKRAYLISSLQTAFKNFSHFHTIIDDLESDRISKWGIRHMSLQLQQEYPDSPSLVTASQKLNPEFVAYWQQNTLSR